jgi:uncharacterized protein (DUF1697 family)
MRIAPYSRGVATWAALLRAVNLGSRNKVPMARLRDALAAAGYEDVRTLIQSGNVVFTATSPDAAAIEALIAAEFGVQTVVVLRTARGLRALADAHPFGRDTSRTHVTFVRDKATRDSRRALEAVAGADEFALVGGDVVVRYPGGYGSATLTAARIEKALGTAGTARNWRTVEKLAELMSPARARSS